MIAGVTMAQRGYRHCYFTQIHLAETSEVSESESGIGHSMKSSTKEEPHVRSSTAVNTFHCCGTDLISSSGNRKTNTCAVGRFENLHDQ